MGQHTLPREADELALWLLNIHPRIGVRLAARSTLRFLPAFTPTSSEWSGENSEAAKNAFLERLSDALSWAVYSRDDLVETWGEDLDTSPGDVANRILKSVIFGATAAARHFTGLKKGSVSSRALQASKSLVVEGSQINENEAIHLLSATWHPEPLSSPLFRENTQAFGTISEIWSNWRNLVNSDPTWDFWLRWYQGILDGSPLDWELTRAVDLIEDDVWQAGPEAVAEAIREIEARLALKSSIENAEIELARDFAQRHGIGGNNPPEKIDAYHPIPVPLQIIWEPFEELKQQAEQAQPDRTRVRTAIHKLNDLVSFCGDWLGGKLDISATEYAKSIGSLSAKATFIWLASQIPLIRSVLDAAKAWFETLGG